MGRLIIIIIIIIIIIVLSSLGEVDFGEKPKLSHTGLTPCKQMHTGPQIEVFLF